MDCLDGGAGVGFFEGCNNFFEVGIIVWEFHEDVWLEV